MTKVLSTASSASVIFVMAIVPTAIVVTHRHAEWQVPGAPKKVFLSLRGATFVVSVYQRLNLVVICARRA